MSSLSAPLVEIGVAGITDGPPLFITTNPGGSSNGNNNSDYHSNSTIPPRASPQREEHQDAVYVSPSQVWNNEWKEGKRAAKVSWAIPPVITVIRDATHTSETNTHNSQGPSNTAALGEHLSISAASEVQVVGPPPPPPPISEGYSNPMTATFNSSRPPAAAAAPPPAITTTSTGTIAASTGNVQSSSSLTLQSLLCESQEQLSELLWYKRRCSVQEAALDAAAARHTSLQDELLKTRMTALTEQQQHRAFVVSTAEELRSLHTSLELKTSAVSILEEQMTELRRELQAARKALQRVERDHTMWKQQHIEQQQEIEQEQRIEEEQQQKAMQTVIVRLREEKEKLDAEVVILRDRCSEMEQQLSERKTDDQPMSHSNITTADNRRTPKNNTSSSSTSSSSSSSSNSSTGDDDVREAEEQAPTLVLPKELERQQLEMHEVKESFSLYRERVSHTVSAVNEKLSLLLRRISERCGSSQCVCEEHPGDAVSVLSCMMRTIEQVWDVMESVQQQQRDEEHEEKERELQVVYAERERLVQQLRGMETRYSHLLRAVERQCRLVIAAAHAHNTVVTQRGKSTAEVMLKKKSKRKEGGEEEEEEEEENKHEDKEGEEEEEEEHSLHPVNRWVSAGEAMRCEEILTPTCEQAVQSLLSRMHLSTRHVIRQLQASHTQHNSLLTQVQDERRQLVANTNESRVRQQQTIKRLQSSLQAAKEVESSLQAQLTAAGRAAVVERQTLQRRVAAVEREARARALRQKEQQQREEELHQQQRRVLEQERDLAIQTIAARDAVIQTLESELTTHRTAARELQFDTHALQQRCEDLTHIADALETHAQRESGTRALVLYELCQQLCSAVTVLVVRLSTVAAERLVLNRRCSTLEADKRTALVLLQELQREFQMGEWSNSAGRGRRIGEEVRRTVGAEQRPLYTLYAVASAVVACVRMQRLVWWRFNVQQENTAMPPHPVYSNNNTINSTRGHSSNNGVMNSSYNAPLHSTTRSLQRLIETVPLAATILPTTSTMAASVVMPVLELPPLSVFLSGITFGNEVNRVFNGNNYNIMQQLFAVAELDDTAVKNHFCFAVDAPLANALLLFPPQRMIRYRAFPPRHQQEQQQPNNYYSYQQQQKRRRKTRPSITVTQELQELLPVLRRQVTTIREKERQQESIIESTTEEKRQLQRKLQDLEKACMESTQRFHEYEAHVATSYVSCDSYQHVQQRLDELHGALEKERAVRRGVEDVNATLRQREVELTKVVHHLRDEVRFLSMELGDRRLQQQRQEQVSLGRTAGGAGNTWGSPLYSLGTGVRGEVGPSGLSTSSHLYVPHSVEMAHAGDNHLVEIPTVAIPSDETVWRIIADIESRLEKSECQLTLHNS